MSSEWHRADDPRDEGDCRKLVTIKVRGGMIYVGIRAWSTSGRCWLNNGVALDGEQVLAWQDLPGPAYDDGLTDSMQSPTLGDHWTT